jgi:hypothetical protein
MKEQNEWDRIEGEPILWFDRFDKYYRILGPERNLQAAYDLYKGGGGSKKKGRVTAAWKKALVDWNWQKRAEAYDMHVRNERLRAEEKERAKMLKDHISMARSMWGFGLAELKRMLKEKTDLNPTEARIYIKDGVTMERQARGLPEYLLEIASLSDEELLGRYTELLARYEGEGGVVGGDQEEELDPAEDRET